MRSTSNSFLRRLIAALGACIFVLIAAGCHRNNLTSGYGLMFTTLTSQRSEFTSYLVTVDYVTLTGLSYGSVTAVDIPEVVDFNRITDISELWANATIPNDTYTTATITLDYTTANISQLINGVPTKLTTIDPTTGVAATTITVTVVLDPTNRVVSVPTFATTAAVRLAISMDMSLSNSVDVAGLIVYPHPFFTMATSAPDQKLIAVRGPLVNSNLDFSTFSVYVRPFYDEVNTAGTLSLFNDPNTIYTIDGLPYQGATAGISKFSQVSTGTSMTLSLTTYEPTLTPAATAAIFHAQQVIAGSTYENFETGGLEGEVIARNGNTLTLRATTLGATTLATAYFDELDATVVIGPQTLVTQDGTINQAGLNYNSVAVGQHVIARGIYTIGDFVTVGVAMDATSTSEADTGSVRIVPTEAYGSFVSTAGDSVVMNLQYLNKFPVSIYNFAGNGTVDPANFQISTEGLAVPVVAAGGPLFVDGIIAPFGTAPPEMLATVIPAEAAVPADMLVVWTGAGTTAPFSENDATGFVIDLTNPAYASGIVNVGAEAINILNLPASPLVIPAVGTPPTAAGLPSVFLPLFALGTPAAAAVGTTAAVEGVTSVFNTLSQFQATLATDVALSTPLLVSAFAAHGYYDRASNTFTAVSININFSNY